ncbi:leucine-rich repeat domain-containing protein [candidate division KSB1 bacterium]|nr:leucine-rich repeat domain-containing protein [candidate division KSB1 bacterium]
MIKLQNLELFNNRLTGSPPIEMKYLVKLKILDLAGNNLSGPLPSEWSD